MRLSNSTLVIALAMAIVGCNRTGPANNSTAGSSGSGNTVFSNATEAKTAVNGAERNEAAPLPASSDPVALAAANLARDEVGRDPGAPALEEVYPEAKGMPADVQEYIVRHQGCSHWGGEPGFDANRQKQIDEAVASLCTGLDRLGREVRARYAANRQVLDRIRDFEPLEE